MDEIEEIVIILEILKRRRLVGGLPAAGPVFLPAAAAPSEYGDGEPILEEEGAAVISEGEESYDGEGFGSTGSSELVSPYIGGGGDRGDRRS